MQPSEEQIIALAQEFNAVLIEAARCVRDQVPYPDPLWTLGEIANRARDTYIDLRLAQIAQNTIQPHTEMMQDVPSSDSAD